MYKFLICLFIALPLSLNGQDNIYNCACSVNDIGTITFYDFLIDLNGESEKRLFVGVKTQESINSIISKSVYYLVHTQNSLSISNDSNESTLEINKLKTDSIIIAPTGINRLLLGYGSEERIILRHIHEKRLHYDIQPQIIVSHSDFIYRIVFNAEYRIEAFYYLDEDYREYKCVLK